MSTTLKRMLSLVLCLVMLTGAVPVHAFAAEGETAGSNAVQETVSAETTQATVPETTNATTEAVSTDPTGESTIETTEESVPETTVAAEPVVVTAAPKASAPEHVDAAVFFSDLHTSKSDYKESTLKNIMSAVESTGLSVSSVTSCGDAFSVNYDSGKYTGYTSTLTGYIQEVFGDVPVNYVWSDHDRYALQEDDETLLSNESGMIYGAGDDGIYGTNDDGNYYIFSLSMADLSTNNRYNADFHTNAEVTEAIAAFTAAAEDLKKDRPLFIASHQPLLDRRNDNGHALEWCNAINAVAEEMDVAYFFGHNHAYDDAGDYYYAKGSTMSVCNSSSGSAENVKLNFTHLCTGYMSPTTTGTATRKGVAVAVTIFEDSINYTTYNASGVYSGSYAVNKTVTRDHADAVTEEPEVTEPSAPSEPEVTAPDRIEVSGTDAYTVGDTLSLTVKGYVDDAKSTTSEDIALSDCTVTITCPSGHDCTLDTVMEKVAIGEDGNYHQVTVTYMGASDNFLFSVGEANDLGNSELGVRVSVNAAVSGAVTVAESADENVASAMETAKVTNYKAYDITTEIPLKAGNRATVTLPIPEGVKNPVVYHISDDGATVTDMKAKNNGDGTVSFVTDHFSIYAVGDSRISEPMSGSATITGSTTEDVTVYVRVNSLTNGGKYLIVNSTDEQALANNGGADTSVGVTLTSGSITVDGTTYTEYIQNPSASAIWTASTSGTGFRLANDGDYLIARSSSSDMISSSGSAWSYSTSNSRLSARGSNGTTYYVRYSNGDWSNNSSSNNASQIHLYKEVTYKKPVETSNTYTVSAKNIEVVLSENTGTRTLEYSLMENGVAIQAPSDGTWKIEKMSDSGNVISGISGNTISFTGNPGEAYVKISYTWGEYTAYKYITVTATEPYYTLDILKDGTVVTGTTVAVKQVTKDETMSLASRITFTDANGTGDPLTELPTGATLEWNIPAEYHKIATIDKSTGLITFTGEDGAFYVTATLTVGGKTYTAGVNVSATKDNYNIPTDGTGDFPEYPNEGAIRYDKTATGVGNFSETGIAKIELSMTGVPYTTGSEMDVVLMLDRSSSMRSNNRIAATVEAAKVFVENVVKNADGTFNGNRIIVAEFLGGNPDYAGQSQHDLQLNALTTNEDSGYQIVNDQAELDALLANIESKFVVQTNVYGTDYANSLEYCYNALQATKADGNKQFCVFMSDGIPNVYEGEKTYFESTTDIVAMFGGTNDNTRNGSTSANPYEYDVWSTKMKEDGVTVFSVGLGLASTNSAWSGASAIQCENVAKILLNDISGPAGETAADRDTGSELTKENNYFFNVADADSATQMSNVFANIAQKILQAATDVTVEDKVDDGYTMIFDLPKGNKAITGLDGQDFYIEFLEYTLDANHERVGSGTAVSRLYLKDSNGDTAGGNYTAAKDSDGTAYDKPVFANKTIGEFGTLYYWTTDATAAPENPVTYTDGTTTYYFIPYGKTAAQIGEANLSKWFNMTSGGYASGTIDGTTNTSDDVVIATPYYVYSAKTRMLYWTVDKLSTTEYALSYFVYLDGSATNVGEAGELAAGSYPTNEWAYLTYTNFNGNECRQEFPVPQMTWNGAQVSYVFYLVNADGQPINRSGQIVDFANASFITDVYTDSVVWNKGLDGTSDGSGKLSADWLATELLPDGYTIYDEKAGYELHVWENADGTTIKNQFTIQGGEAAEISTSLNSRLNLNTTATSVSTVTTKVYNTKAGTKVTGYGTYYSSDDDMKGFDFSNTTVAFAVVWEPRLTPDTVVVDYGLDVLINVTENDLLDNTTITGLSTTSTYGNIAMNSGISTSAKMDATPKEFSNKDKIRLENSKQIRFTQGDMQFQSPVTFYYETPVTFWENAEKHAGYMYSSVTVIPATTVYYEDSFVTLKTFTAKKDEEGNIVRDAEGKIVYSETDGWDTKSVKDTVTQAQDRPGKNQGSGTLDADNVYGYDDAYSNSTTYSLGNNAPMITVASGKYGTATFEFYGTGFDIISSTSRDTGTITVKVEGDNYTKNLIVDTYYGYQRTMYTVIYKWNGEEWFAESKEVAPAGSAVSTGAMPENPAQGQTVTRNEWIWKPAADNTNGLYQVPVMKVTDLPYDKYKVTVKAAYNSVFDNVEDNGSYDMYLDAIRIYDPTGVVSGKTNTTVSNAYKADGEGWAKYSEVRNIILAAETFHTVNAQGQPVKNTEGIMFIDHEKGSYTIADYAAYGPNNELYLAQDQAIAFILDPSLQYSSYDLADVQIGLKSANGSSVFAELSTYTKNENGSYAVKSSMAKITGGELKTSTDRYYSIKSYVNTSGETVLSIKNTGSGILSITNIKLTFNAAPVEKENGISLFAMTRSVADGILLAMNTADNAVEEPEEVPDAELNVSLNKKSVKVGGSVQVKVTTSADVDALSVNGQEITKFKQNNKTGKRTWTVKVTAEEAGDLDIEVIAKSADGKTLDSVVETVEVTAKKSGNVNKTVGQLLGKLFG